MKIFGLIIKRAENENASNRWYKYIESDKKQDYHLLTVHKGQEITQYVIADDPGEDCNAYEHRSFIKDDPGITRITLRKLRS